MDCFIAGLLNSCIAIFFYCSIVILMYCGIDVLIYCFNVLLKWMKQNDFVKNRKDLIVCFTINKKKSLAPVYTITQLKLVTYYFIIFLGCISQICAAQYQQNTPAYLQGSDTTNASEFYKRVIAIPPTINKSRYKAVAIGSGVIWGGTLVFLNSQWYSQFQKSSFHLYNDGAEWQQIDKVGHVYSAYLGTKLFSTFFRWTGLNEKKSVIIGAGGGLAYQSIIEILDGFSAKWGFSWADMGMNTLGCSMYASQQLLWHEQRIKIKYSWHIKDYKEVELLRRANNLYGEATAELVLKDYNAQTYWLSANIKSFTPSSKWPAWLNIAVGYGANNMYGGYTNKWIDENNVPHDRTDIIRYRQFFVSPDIDFSKLPWRSKFLKDFFKIVNLKMPLPSLEYNTLGQWKGNLVHF